MRLKPVVALALTVGLGLAQPARGQTNTGPVAANAFITVGGLDWAWAGPCFFGTPSCLNSWIFADGFTFATAGQWAARPDPSAFLDPSGNFFDPNSSLQMRCASAWFDVDPAYTNCDYNDAVQGAVTSGPSNGGTYAGGTDPFDPLAETWLVRAGQQSVVPEPATMTLLAAGLVSLAATGRRRKRATG